MMFLLKKSILIPESNSSTVNGFEPKTWFRPLDKRIPLFYIPIGNGPADVRQNENYYKTRLYVVKYYLFFQKQLQFFPLYTQSNFTKKNLLSRLKWLLGTHIKCDPLVKL